MVRIAQACPKVTGRGRVEGRGCDDIDVLVWRAHLCTTDNNELNRNVKLSCSCSSKTVLWQGNGDIMTISVIASHD